MSGDESSVDVAIIGGGIQGAGVAQAAAAAGYSVILIEKEQLAAGTSSKSSKLIHGGLRYLQQGQIGLVKEALRERHILSRIAPHLVHLNKFYIPVYRHSHYRPWQIRAALSLYALLAGLNREAFFYRVPRNQWRHLSGIETRDLQAVFCYWDGQTDDLRLTEAVMKSALELGAALHIRTELLSATGDDSGYLLQLSADERKSLRCKVLVNATGPWVNIVAGTVHPAPPILDISLVQGSHLVLEKPLSDSCFYLESPDDHRAIFALPWHGKTLLGTTEKEFSGNPDQVRVTEEEERYLLKTLKSHFPDYDQSPEISARMAGLRVLPATEGSAFSRSREMRLATNVDQGSSYIAIYGGKLTGYRANALKVVEHIKKHLGKRTAWADTEKRLLP